MLGKQLSTGQGESVPFSLLKRICTGRTELVGWIRDRDAEREQKAWGWRGQTWPSKTKDTSANEWSESQKLDGNWNLNQSGGCPRQSRQGIGPCCEYRDICLAFFFFLRTFLMGTIFKVFIEFVTILLPFYVLVFWPRGMSDLKLLDQGSNPHSLHWQVKS